MDINNINDIFSGFYEMGEAVKGELESLHFTGLLDAPAAYESGKYLVSNTGGVEWRDLDLGSNNFTGLGDTPASYESGKYLVSNTGGVEWRDLDLGSNNFTGLGDTPASYESGKYLVSSTGGVEWRDLDLGSNNFTGLGDTPASYESGKYLVSSTGGVEWRDLDLGSNNFTGLGDTPANYESGKYLVSSDNGVEWRDLDLGSNNFTGLGDTPANYESGKYLVSSDNGVEWRNVSTSFTGLSDTPAAYASGKYLVSSDNGVEWRNVSTSFTGLSDTPAAYASGKYLVSSDNGVEWRNVSTSFTGLSDTPAAYASGKYLASSDNGVEWRDFSTSFTGISDTPDTYLGHGDKFLKVSPNEDKIEFRNSASILGLDPIEGYDFCADCHLQSDHSNNSSTLIDSSINSLSILNRNVKHSNGAGSVFSESTTIYFNGDARLSVGENTTFKALSSKLIENYTIQLWINLNQNNIDQPILGTAGLSYEHGFRLIVRSDNKLQFDVFKGNSNSSSVTFNSSSALQLNTWTHVALVNEEYTLKFYIDGVESGSIEWTNTGSNIDPAIPLQIGGLAIQSSSIEYFDGYMQDIRIDRTAFNVDFLPPTTLSNPICNTSQSPITLTSLKDTPVNYTNAGGKYIRVAENESKVEFVGINIAGSTNNQFSDNFLSSDITSDQQISDFTFGGLDLGKTYRLSSTICLNANGSSDFPKVDFYNGTNKILSLFSKGSSSTVSNSMLFIARDSNITVSGRDLSSSAYLMGDPEISFVQLELPPTIAVELEEEIFYPPFTGNGVFAIGDVTAHGIIYDMSNQSNNINSLIEPTQIHFGEISMYAYMDKGETGIKTFEQIDSSMTSFSVLNIGDMNLTANMNHTGVDDQSSNFPDTLSFDWQ